MTILLVAWLATASAAFIIGLAFVAVVGLRRKSGSIAPAFADAWDEISMMRASFRQRAIANEWTRELRLAQRELRRAKHYQAPLSLRTPHKIDSPTTRH